MLSFIHQPSWLPHSVTVLLVTFTICTGTTESHAQSTSRRSARVPKQTSTENIDKTAASPRIPQPQTSNRSVQAQGAGNIRPDRSLESLSELMKSAQSNFPAEGSSTASARSNTYDFKKRNEARIDSIHERISLIKQLIQKEKAEAAAQATNPLSQENTTPGAGENQTFDSTDEAGGPEPKQMNPTEQDQTMLTQPAPDSATMPTLMPTKDMPPSDTGSELANAGDSPWQDQISTEPIDSFELATSLFMTGNYQAAKKTCKARLQSDVDREQAAWLQCMIGCCERIMGDYSNAEASFRDVTNDRLQSYPVDYARWNLGYIQQRQQMQTQFEQVAAEIDAIITEEQK